MTDAASAQASLEVTLKDEIVRMYQEVADNPKGEFHFLHGREAAELFGYAPEWLDRAPVGAVASFAGVGNPHERSNLQPGETVLDLGSGAGLDAIIASWRVGSTGRVVGVDLNPHMCLKAQAHAAATRRSLGRKAGGAATSAPMVRPSLEVGTQPNGTGFTDAGLSARKCLSRSGVLVILAAGPSSPRSLWEAGVAQRRGVAK